MAINEKAQLQEYIELDKKMKAEKKFLKPLLEKGTELVDSAIVNGSDAVFLDEIRIVKSHLEYLEDVSVSKAALKEAQEALNLAVLKQYAKLTEKEIKVLVVKDKWLATLEANIVTEIERVIQRLANRVKELDERYAEPLPSIEQSVGALSEKVYAHLEAMGMRLSGELKMESGK